MRVKSARSETEPWTSADNSPTLINACLQTHSMYDSYQMREHEIYTFHRLKRSKTPIRQRTHTMLWLTNEPEHSKKQSSSCNTTKSSAIYAILTHFTKHNSLLLCSQQLTHLTLPCARKIKIQSTLSNLISLTFIITLSSYLCLGETGIVQ